MRHASLGDLLDYAATAPFGFCALLKLFHLTVDDPELSLQLFPFLCSLAVLPAFGWLVTRLTGWRSLGILAAAFLAAAPLLWSYSAHVKPYPSDALCVTLLLIAGLGTSALADARWQRLLWFGVGSFVAALLSYVSLAVSVLLIHLPLAAALRDSFAERRSLPLRSLGVVAVFDMLIAALYFFRLRIQSRPDIHDHWSGRYLPIDSWQSVVHFFRKRGLEEFATMLPIGREPTARMEAVSAALFLAVMAGGLSVLASRANRRLEGAFFVLFFVLLVGVSAAHAYPFGGRPWIFTFPVFLALGAIAIGCAFDAANRVLPRAESWLAGGTTAVALAIVVLLPPGAVYRLDCGSKLVRALDAEARPDDLVVFSRQGQHMYGYYATREIEPVFRNESKKFTFRPVGWKAQILEEETPKSFVLEALTDRVFYFVNRGRPLNRGDWQGAVDQSLRDAGYRLVDTQKCQRSSLATYERTPPSG